MNSKLPDAIPEIPELCQFQALDSAPAELLHDANLQALSEARMFQIMAQPVDNGNPAAKRFATLTRARRAVIATLAALAVGLSGATAATAIGIGNPIGDWVSDVFGNPVPETMQQRNNDPNRGPVSVVHNYTNEFWNCTFVWHVDRPGSFDSRFEVTQGEGIQVNPEIPALGWISVGPRDDIAPPTPEELNMLTEAAEILAEIDFATLPGTFVPPSVNRSPAIRWVDNRDEDAEIHAGLSSTPQTREFQEQLTGGAVTDPANAEFHAALESEFDRRLAAAGINPENVTLNWTMDCTGVS